MGYLREFKTLAQDSIGDSVNFVRSGRLIKDPLDSIGLTDYRGERNREKSANEAADNANKAQEKAFDLAERNLEFQTEQYSEWKNIFGDIQENLGKYYKSLGAEKIASIGLQRQQKAYQTSVSQIKQNLARRGLGNSKFEDYILSNAELSNQTQKANIVTSSEDEAQRKQLQFLSLGLGQKQGLLNNVSNAYNSTISAAQSQAGTFINKAGMHNNQFVNTQNNNSAMMRQLVGELGEFAGTRAGGL